MRAIVACEYSGLVREALKAEGWEAWSCDLLPTEIPGNHYQGSVLDILHEGWDLMIAHPPCTYITYARNAYKDEPGAAAKRLQALIFFNQLLEAPIKHICVENPLGYADSVVRKHDQIIHPYYFGDDDMKRTCLWLKNLPKLVHTKQNDLFTERTHIDKPEPTYVDKSGKKRYFVDSIAGRKGGGHLRSRTFAGIANAMATQFTNYLKEIYGQDQFTLHGRA